MATDLSFFEYKRTVLAGYETNSTVAPYHDLDTTSFYRKSFDNRRSFELDFRLLNKLVHVHELPEEYKKQIEYYIEAGAKFLERDATIADNTAEAKGYSDQLADIELKKAQAAEPLLAAAPTTETEWQKSVNRLYKDLFYFFGSYSHISNFITVLSYATLYRLVSLFSRLSVKFFWILASERHWLDAQDKLFGYTIQRPALDIPAAGLNFLSVALFALRLIAHGLMIYKHAVSQREGEKNIDMWDRIMREVSTRLINIMNDLAWLIINLFTNYAAVWGIADPVANALVTLALVWDCSWLVIHWYREERDWANQQKMLEDWRDQTLHANDKGIARFQLLMLADLQLETRAKYAFMILAGLAITTSYLLFLASISTLVSTVALCVCVVGFAMYGSADEFAAVVRAYFGKLEISNEREEMRAKFFTTFTKTLLPPFIVMGLLSLGWQVAVLGALAAVAFSYAPAKWDCFNRPGGAGGQSPETTTMVEPPLLDAGRNNFGMSGGGNR